MWCLKRRVCRAPQVSPLVQRGLILNERTGKAIKIGGATYNRLVLQACVLRFRVRVQGFKGAPARQQSRRRRIPTAWSCRRSRCLILGQMIAHNGNPLELLAAEALVSS